MNKKQILLVCLSFISYGQIWSQDVVVDILSPSSIQGEYESFIGDFGAGLCDSDITAPIMEVDDGTSDITLACTGVINNLSGKIALIDRGNCNFSLNWRV